MFFGVPHKGANIAAKASKFLSLLGHVFNVNKNNVQDLEPKSQRFANISSEFRSVQSEHNIPVVSFFETVKYNHTVGLVSRTFILCLRKLSRGHWRLSIQFGGLWNVVYSQKDEAASLRAILQHAREFTLLVVRLDPAALT